MNPGKFEEGREGMEAAAAGATEGEVWHADPIEGRRQGGKDLRAGSVQWEVGLLDKLNVLAVQQHVTKQAIHNILLAQFLALPPERQSPVLRKARDWELDRRRR